VVIGLEMTDNVSEKIRAFNAAILDDDAVDRLFQHLVDTGQVWQMEARYGKTAQKLAEAEV
jgi:hypothetical protein